MEHFGLCCVSRINDTFVASLSLSQVVFFIHATSIYPVIVFLEGAV
jgi:hypothetical protein